MQTIARTLRIDTLPATFCNDLGSPEQNPSFIVGTALQFVLDLRAAPSQEEDAAPPFPYAQLAACDSFYVAVDADFSQGTAPFILYTTGISVSQDAAGHTLLTVQVPNTNVAALKSYLGSSASAPVKVEVGGLDANAATVFCTCFDVSVRNRVWLPDGTPDTPASDPEYYTAAEVRALVAAATVPAQSFSAYTAASLAPAPGAHKAWAPSADAAIVFDASDYAAGEIQYTLVDLTLASGASLAVSGASLAYDPSADAPEAGATSRYILLWDGSAAALYRYA